MRTKNSGFIFYKITAPKSPPINDQETIRKRIKSELPSSTSSTPAPQAPHIDILSGPAVVPIATHVMSPTDTTRVHKPVITTSAPNTQSNAVPAISTTTSTVQLPAGMTLFIKFAGGQILII